MAMSEKTKTALSAAVDPMKAKEHEIIEQYLEQLHADYDPVYSMLLNYECAVMEVETKFNILNNRLSIQGEQNPIESIKSRVKSLDSIIRKLEKLNLPIELESVEKNLKDVAGVRVVCSFVDDIYRIEKCFLEQEDVTLITRKDYIKNRHRSIRKTGKRICSLKCRCGRSQWISGQVWNTSFGIRRISIREPQKSWPKSWQRARKKAQLWMRECSGFGSVLRRIDGIKQDRGRIFREIRRIVKSGSLPFRSRHP